MNKLAIIFALFLIGSASACVNLSDNSTWGTDVINSSGVLYVNRNTTLCVGTYYINAAASTGVLRMNASNIYLNCNGSVLDGGDTDGYGVLIPPLRDNNTVGNCTLRSYQIGIFDLGENNRISLNYAHNNSYGIFVQSSANGGDVEGNTAYNNSYGITFNAVNFSVAENNILHRNSYGFFLYSDALFNNLTNNTIYNTTTGIYIRETNNNNTAINNTIFNMVSHGFDIRDAASGNLIQGNNVTNCTGGAFFSNAGGNIYRNNIAANGGTHGFRAQGVDGNIYINNTAFGNINQGFSIDTGSDYTVLENNTAYNNSQYGFYIYSSDSNNLTKNYAHSNTFSGFYLYGTGNTFANNSAYNNTLDGFYIASANNNILANNSGFNNSRYGMSLTSSTSTIIFGNAMHSNTQYGLLIQNSEGTNATNTHAYGNIIADLFVQSTTIPASVYFDNLTLDNPSGTMQNYTSIDLTDAAEAGTYYTIKYSQNNTALPNTRTSFLQKFINITSPNTSISIDSITWRWTFAETSGYEERKFELWKYGTSWSRISNEPDQTAHTFTITGLNPASLYGIFQSNVVTAPVLADGFFGYDYQAIPSRGDIEGDIENYTFTLIGMKLDYLNFDQDWNTTKDRLDYTYAGFNRQTFILLQLNTSNYSQYSSECAKINANMSDLSDYPYADALAFIVIGTNGTNEGNRTTYINEIAKCLANATSNHVNVYSEWHNESFDFDFVSNYSLIRISDAGSIPQTVATEAGYMRNSTQMTRIYGVGGAEFKAWASSFYLTIMQNIRGAITGTSPGWSSIAALISNGDVVIFNNGSAANISLNLTGSSPNDAWDINRKKLYTNLATGANTSIDVLENNVTLLYVDNFTRFVMTSSTESTLYKDVMGAQGEQDYFNGSTAADATYQLKGANDVRVELWDPSYVTDPLMFHSYEQLPYTQVVDFCDYGMVVIAGGANTPAIVNTSLRVSECEGILSRTYGYISVADYDDTNETDCAVANDWEANKTIEINNWTQNFQTNVFIDGFDIGAVGSPACFEQRIKRLMNHVHDENKLVIANTYTIYQTIVRYSDYTMRESCFSRWDGDVGSPTYSYEDMALMEASAQYFSNTGDSMLCMAFGDVTDYDKMAFDYHAWAVMYGTEGNYFRYAQPNFQTQREIRVADFGTQLQNRFVKASDTDWYRIYSNGIVHFDPTRNVTFTNGKYYWFENGETINWLNITARYQVVDSACFADHNPYLIVNENTSTQQLVSECDEVGALQWESNWVSKNFTEDYQPHGHYFIRSYPSVRGDANGLNIYNLPGTANGVHSWHDESTQNPPVEANWTAYGRSGTSGDFNTTNWQMNITMNRSYSTAIDTDIGTILTQSSTFSNSTERGNNISLTSVEPYNLTTISYQKYVSIIPTYVRWNGTLLNVTTDSECLGNNPPFSYSVANGNTIGVCRASVGDYFYYVFSAPHFTGWDFYVTRNMTCFTCPSPAANWTIDMTDECSINWYCDISGYDLVLNGAGNVWINQSILIRDLVNLTAGKTVWMRPAANVTIGATASSFCYQETATTATGCGGLDTGAYACTGTWSVGNPCANVYDGDWDTYGTSTITNVATLFMNYTKPASATGATWYVKDLVGTENITIPTSCWDAYADRLALETFGSHDSMYSRWACYNTTGDWQIIRTDAATEYRAFEEGIWWEMT